MSSSQEGHNGDPIESISTQASSLAEINENKLKEIELEETPERNEENEKRNEEIEKLKNQNEQLIIRESEKEDEENGGNGGNGGNDDDVDGEGIEKEREGNTSQKGNKNENSIEFEIQQSENQPDQPRKLNINATQSFVNNIDKNPNYEKVEIRRWSFYTDIERKQRQFDKINLFDIGVNVFKDVLVTVGQKVKVRGRKTQTFEVISLGYTIASGRERLSSVLMKVNDNNSKEFTSVSVGDLEPQPEQTTLTDNEIEERLTQYIENQNSNVSSSRKRKQTTTFTPPSTPTKKTKNAVSEILIDDQAKPTRIASERKLNSPTLPESKSTTYPIPQQKQQKQQQLYEQEIRRPRSIINYSFNSEDDVNFASDCDRNPRYNQPRKSRAQQHFAFQHFQLDQHVRSQQQYQEQRRYQDHLFRQQQQFQHQLEHQQEQQRQSQQLFEEHQSFRSELYRQQQDFFNSF